MYTRILIALLAATAVVARPQDDVLEELDPFGDVGAVEGGVITGDPPTLDVATKAEGETCAKDSPSSNQFQCGTGLTCVQKPGGTGNTYGFCRTKCTFSATSDSCATGFYCKPSTGTSGPGACVPGCKKNPLIAGECPTADPTKNQYTPVVCTSHVCTYSNCLPASGSGATAVLDTCSAGKWCKPQTDGTNKCTNGCKADPDCPGSTCNLGTHACNAPAPAPGPSPPTKCNAYKKCADGFYCHNRKCKEGCDEKYSACKKPKTGGATGFDNGTCNGKHECIVYVAKETGAPCKKKSDCKTGTGSAPSFKCVRDEHGHKSHCHKIAKENEACNQRNVLFADVCGKDLVCKKKQGSYKCVKEEHKRKDHYRD